MVAVSLLLLLAASPASVSVTASFVAPQKGTPASVAVRFSPADPDIWINEEPAPRLKLDPAQTVLVEQKPVRAKRSTVLKAGEVKYLDTALPVLFPVTWNPVDGPRNVKASVTYFYCSKREGWCRKGTAEVELPVAGR